MILSLIALIFTAIAIGAAVLLTWTRQSRMDSGAEESGNHSVRNAWLIVALMAVITVLSTGLRIIDAGHVGVVTWFGRVENRTLEPGLQFVTPIAENVIPIETRVQGINFENLAAASLEYQDVLITGTLNIHIDGPQADDLYQDVGLDYINRVVNPFLNTFVKQIVPEYEIDTILLKREEIRVRAAEALGEKLADYHIVVDDLAFAQISFSPEYTAAVEEKQVQEQRVLTERQILEQRRIQADQAVATAEGEAASIVARAKGQAEANQLLSSSLTPILVQWQAIQRLNDKISVVLLPSDNNFLLDVNRFLPEQP